MNTELLHATYDVIIIGGGIAGLWLANRLKREGYHILLVDNGKLGEAQTLASQGMIHGGQKYTLQGLVSGHASAIAQMPERWDACFEGYGEIDLTGVRFLSETQVMWPAGNAVASAAVFAASKLVNAGTKKLKKDHFPQVFMDAPAFKGSLYEMPEKVLDTRSLLQELAKNLQGCMVQGEVTELLPDGQIAISGHPCQAQAVVFTAGKGNETAFKLLRIKEQKAQRRPLRQVMVRPMPYVLHGHGISGNPKPRVTITSHPLESGDFVWYLGGNIAETGAKLSEAEALVFAQKEMKEMFPHVDWEGKFWATWEGDRAEPFSVEGDLPPGPHVHQRGKVLVAWPTKLTFTPLLADTIMNWMREKEIEPLLKNKPAFKPSTALLDLPAAEIGRYPWETATWVKAGGEI